MLEKTGRGGKMGSDKYERECGGKGVGEDSGVGEKVGEVRRGRLGRWDSGNTSFGLNATLLYLTFKSYICYQLICHY